MNETPDLDTMPKAEADLLEKNGEQPSAPCLMKCFVIKDIGRVALSEL